MIMWMYEQVQPRETKQIAIIFDREKINRLSLRKTIFSSFDVLCGGKKKIIHQSKWKISNDGNYYIDIPEKLLTQEKSIKLYARNKSEYALAFDGWFSNSTSVEVVDIGWQMYEQPGIAVVNQRAVGNMYGRAKYDENWLNNDGY